MACRKYWLWLAVLAAVGFSNLIAAAQPAAPAATVPYRDKSFGFEMQLPAGWRYDRAQFPGPDHSVGVLRGFADDDRRSLQIIVFRKPAEQKLADWVTYFAQQLKRVGGAERIAAGPFAGEAKEAALVRVDAEVEGRRVQTWYYCTELDPATVLTFSCALADRANLLSDPRPPGSDADAIQEVPQDFRDLCASLRALYDPSLRKALDDSLQRGRDFVAQGGLARAGEQVHPNGEASYYLWTLNGKRIGYLERSISSDRRGIDDARFTKHPEHQAGQVKPGFCVNEDSWRFGDDGSAFRTRCTLFASADGARDESEFRDTTIPAAASEADAQAGRAFTTYTSCIREGDMLITSVIASLVRQRPEPRDPIRAEPGYIGLAWSRVLPAFLPADSQPLAFLIYDNETRSLVPYEIEPVESDGSAHPRDDASGSKPVRRKFRTREGLIDDSGSLYLDENGLMSRFESGPLVLEMTNKAAVEQMFAAKRDAAVARAAAQNVTPSRKP